MVGMSDDARPSPAVSAATLGDLSHLPLLLTSEEVAGLLRIPVRTVQDLARAGQLPHTKVGAKYRFARDVIAGKVAEAGGAAR